MNVVSRATPRARRRETKARAIVEAAARAIRESGVDALTLERVADACDLVTTAVYRYFPSKAALLAAVRVHAVTEVSHVLEAGQSARCAPIRAAADVSTLVRVFALATAYRALPIQRPDAWPSVCSGPELEASALYVGFIGEARTLFEEAARAGSVSRGDAGARADVLWCALHGANVTDVHHDLARRDALTSMNVRVVLRGFGADPRVIARAERVRQRASDQVGE